MSPQIANKQTEAHFSAPSSSLLRSLPSIYPSSPPRVLQRVVWHMLVAHERSSEGQGWESWRRQRAGDGRLRQTCGDGCWGTDWREKVHCDTSAAQWETDQTKAKKKWERGKRSILLAAPVGGTGGSNQIYACLTKPIASLCSPQSLERVAGSEQRYVA